jgi:RimJ/RimL family protein N-acetyltransferase
VNKRSGTIVETPRILLRTLELSDATPAYLGWLNDPEVAAFTRRRGRTFTMQDLTDFIERSLASPDYHLAICLRESGEHLGNISLNSIDPENKSAEISIMMGSKNSWGKGIGAEAVKALASFAHKELGLHRVWAESPNPAFNRLMEKLRWTREGVKRDSFLKDGRFIDLECWSHLSHENNHS